MSIDSEGVFTTETGTRVPMLEDTASMFLDRTIINYGPTRTGKTVITKHIMKVLNGHIDQVVVVSPTEPTNRSYEGFVDPACIHTRLYLADPANPKKDDGPKGAIRFIRALWDRQQAMAATHARANRPEVLAQLFRRLPSSTRGEAQRRIDTIDKERERVVSLVRRQFKGDQGRSDGKEKEVNAKFKKMLTLIYKKYITIFYEELWERADLSADEQWSLTYLSFNPRILLILDDCAAELKPLFKHEVFRLLFYQNRHCHITVILCCQDDTDLPTNLRKNAFLSFFTEGVVCQTNFNRSSNSFPKPTKELVADISASLFTDRFRKLAYVRDDERRQHFYYVKFPEHPLFRFGSEAFRQLCDNVQTTEDAMDTENPYYDRFSSLGRK